jgi:two-component system, chemotaxis family, chemotaxis protein CheY
MNLKLRALVVDDSPIMRNMVKQTLVKTGLAEFEFTEAVDGEDALAKFDRDKVDIGFVDWNMPKMTGVDFVRAVRAQGDTRHIPFIMVTSEKTMSKIEEALDQAGADAFICKPFTADEMKMKVDKAIKKLLEARKERREQKAGDRAADSGQATGGFFKKLFS